ncbi:MAG: DNA polymerase I [Oscillospiraceae bacterium]|jgi:DNA polymerase I-like protein with 3'-5' exonuclease and polymerase domains/5'-3' exonuclease|nr:DNA polymerase I [Oscillospiraceae bacterium]
MKFLLIDGNSIVNRSFYAIRLLSNAKGVYTNAITGFFHTLIKQKNALEPDYIAVAFDTRAPTFRHEMYDGYKKRRKGMPDELAAQMPYIKQILGFMGISAVEKAGWEADDIIGTLAKFSENENVDCFISTGDRDAFQLITEKVSVCLASTKGEIVYTPEKIKEVYGIEPLRMIEVKALMGDSSDDIPGVSGIGEKTAFSLIQKYGSVDYIYENLAVLELSASVKTKLEKGREMCYLSRELGAISVSAPVTLDLNGYRVSEGDRFALSRLLTELETASLMKKLDIAPDYSVFTAAIPEKPPPIPEGAAFDKELAAYILNADAEKFTPEQLYQMIENEGLSKLLTEVEIPLSRILKDMEETGIKIDEGGIRRFGAELAAGIAETQKEIHALAGGEFNISSPKRLGEVLFDKLGLPNAKKTKTGYSTDSDVLEALAGKHPVISLIAEYRALTKLNSTYVQGLLKAVGEDGRIHTTFRQTETRTGRLSSAEPNIQNIPVRTERGRTMRRFFIAENGNVLIDADYSQIELRVLAHISKDENMLAAFEEGADIHAATAASVFGVSESAVTREMRTAAKAVNFGIVYGMGAFTLSKDIGVCVGEANRYIERYLEKYGGVRDYLERTVDEARKTGRVTTVLGRVRRIPEINSTNKNIQAAGARIAKNTPIQGTAADIIKIAMVRVYNRLKSENRAAKLILQVHDELIVEAPEESRLQAAAVLREEMSAAGGELGIPLIVDVKTGKSWFETH